MLEAPPTPPPAEEVIVTGRAPERAAGERAYSTVEIGQERLRGTPSGRLEEALREVPGFQLFRRSDARSSNPTANGPTLRGLGGNAAGRVLVLLDGVPQADPFGGWIAWPALDPKRLAGARIVRGGGTGAGGPGALAGTLLLESAGTGDLPALRADAAGGSRGGYDVGALAAGGSGGAWASLGGRVQAGEGFAPIVARDRGPVDRRAPYTQGSVAGRLLLPVSDGAELQLSGLLFNDRRDRGLPSSDVRARGADMSARFVGTRVTATAWVQKRDFSTLFTSVSDARDAANIVLDQYAVPATGLGGAFEFRPDLGALDLRLGLDARRATGETRELFSFVLGSPTRRRIAGGRTDVLGAWTEASWSPRADLVLTGGARLDRWWIEQGRQRESVLAGGAVLRDERFPDRAGLRPTARAGLAWTAATGLELRAAAYTGWRLPTLNELYRPYRVGPDAVAANPALRPERLRGVEVGADWRPGPDVRVSATVFDNRLSGAIANVTLGRGPGTFPQVGFVSAAGEFAQRRNLDDVRSRGLEVDAALTFDALELGAAFALTDARVRANGPALQLSGLRPAQVPSFAGTLRASWAPQAGPVRASAILRTVGGQWEDDLNRLRLKSVVTLDGVASTALAPGLRIEARGENLFDAEVQAARTVDGIVERATPRTLWLGLAWAFGDPR